jgi:hypothetical protein
MKHAKNNFTSARGYHAEVPFAIKASASLSQGLRAEHEAPSISVGIARLHLGSEVSAD